MIISTYQAINHNKTPPHLRKAGLSHILCSKDCILYYILIRGDILGLFLDAIDNS